MIDYVFEIIFHLIYILKTIIFDDIIIKTTKEHPFWVEGQGWTKAKFLEAGGQLRDANGNAIIGYKAFASVQIILAFLPSLVITFLVGFFKYSSKLNGFIIISILQVLQILGISYKRS